MDVVQGEPQVPEPGRGIAVPAPCPVSQPYEGPDMSPCEGALLVSVALHFGVLHALGVKPGSLDAGPGDWSPVVEGVQPANHVPGYCFGGWWQCVLTPLAIVEPGCAVAKAPPAPASVSPALGEAHGYPARVFELTLPHDPVFIRKHHDNRDAGMPGTGVYPDFVLLHGGASIACRAVEEADGEGSPGVSYGTS